MFSNRGTRGKSQIRGSTLSAITPRGRLFHNEWVFYQGVTNLVTDGRCLRGVLHLVNYLDKGYENIKITKLNV